jgi:NAD+ diphosphatase
LRCCERRRHFGILHATMKISFTSAIQMPARASQEQAWWFVFRSSELLVIEEPAPHQPGIIPFHADIGALAIEPVRMNYLGTLIDCHCFAVEVADTFVPPLGHTFRGLRAIHGDVPDEIFGVAGRAAQIIEWDRTHQFCGRCGTPMEPAEQERAKRCPRCGLSSFPRLSPAVIMLVERDGKALLAHGAGFSGRMFSCLAGFVEPGESLEEAVAREVREEVGVEIDDITYFGSQPWPFPHSLMIGFTARHAHGEIAIDGVEIEEADWFGPHELPEIPGKLSISRKLIDDFAERHG